MLRAWLRRAVALRARRGARATRVAGGTLGVLAVLVASAAAEVRGGVAAGAGARTGASYQTLEARLEADGSSWRLELALRSRWHDGRWRREDFTTARGLSRGLRALQWTGESAALAVALAAGRLRPEALAQLSDGVQVSLDGEARAGARASVATAALRLRAEVDDVIAPQLVFAAAIWAPTRWELGAAAGVGWGALAAGAPATAFELWAARRLAEPTAGGRLGLGAVGEPLAGAHAVAFAELGVAGEQDRWRLSVRADLRVGTGSLGERFGALAAVGGERVLADGVAVGGGVAAALRGAAGFGELALREGPSGATVSAHVGVAPSARLHLGLYLAADRRIALGAGEVRGFADPRWGAAWRGVFAALEVGRLLVPAVVDAPEMERVAPRAGTQAVAWLGVAR